MRDDQLCLDGIAIIDLSLGMSGALISSILVQAGATARHFVPESGDPFHPRYPACGLWRRGQQIEYIATLDDSRVEETLAAADICIIGGESFPGLDWTLDAETLRQRYKGLVVLDIGGYPAGQPAGLPSSELLVQARSGLCFELYSQRATVFGFPAASLGATLQGLIAVLSALYIREADGVARVARTSLWEGALTWANALWVGAERTSPDYERTVPRDVRPTIFRCADGQFVHFILGSAPNAMQSLHQILGLPAPETREATGFDVRAGDSENYFGDIDLFASKIAVMPSGDLMNALQEAGIPAERVQSPGECWTDRQVIHNGIIRRDEQGTAFVGTPLRISHPASEPIVPAHLHTLASSPLSGIWVLDFGAVVAGPVSTIALADLGARVIKIEPLGGDPLRPFFRFFASANRGKLAIAVDMKTTEGMEILRRLRQRAQVFSNNFRPSAALRLGLDSSSLLDEDPSRVVLELTGYGADGPSANRPGYDPIFQAIVGLDVLAGSPDHPQWNRATPVDYAAGFLGSIGLLLGLLGRKRKKLGAAVSLDLLGAALFLTSQLVQTSDGVIAGCRPLNDSQTGWHPAEALYRCADGWIAIHAPKDEMAERLLVALELNPDEHGPPAQWGDDVARAIAERLEDRPLAEALALLDSFDVWRERVETDGYAQTLTTHGEPTLPTIARWADAVHGEVAQLGRLFQVTGLADGPATGVPGLGRDTSSLLQELGYSDPEIGELYRRKIVA